MEDVRGCARCQDGLDAHICHNWYCRNSSGEPGDSKKLKENSKEGGNEFFFLNIFQDCIPAFWPRDDLLKPIFQLWDNIAFSLCGQDHHIHLMFVTPTSNTKHAMSGLLFCCHNVHLIKFSLFFFVLFRPCTELGQNIGHPVADLHFHFRFSFRLCRSTFGYLQLLFYFISMSRVHCLIIFPLCLFYSFIFIFSCWPCVELKDYIYIKNRDV